MLSSLIVQLCGSRPDSPQSLLDLRRYKDTNRRPDIKALETILRATMADFENVYLVIDALDECPMADQERERLLAWLQRIHRWREPDLHLLVTSRKEGDIRDELGPLLDAEGAVETYLEEQKDSVNRDIKLYIDEKMVKSKFNKWPEEIKSLMRETLIGKADAM